MARQSKYWYGLAAVSLLYCAPPLGAASLTGIVKDPSGGVVTGATAVAANKTLPAPLEVASDAQGRFRFDNLAPGAYRISVTKDGFEPWERSVTMADRPVELAVSLKLKTVTTSVRVSGLRSPLANSDPNYRSIRAGKLTKVYRVDHVVLTRDVGTFTFQSGSFSFLPPVLNHVTTGVFVGEGNFKLTPAYDLAVKHLHRIAGVDSVDEDFDAMVVYFSDSTFDEIRQHSELADESPQRHEDALKRVKERLEQRREPGMLTRLTMLERLLNYEDIPNYEAEILAELYNPAERGSFRAFLHGKKHADLRFLLNPRGAMPMLPAPEEIALLNFDPLGESDGVWYLSHFVSELKAGQASSGEDKRVIVPEHYRIEAAIGKQNLMGKEPDIGVTCDLRFHSADDGTRMVKFDLVPDLQVSRVVWNGKEIPFIQESRKQDGSFYLQMPEPLVKGRPYQVTFEYSGGEIVQTQIGVPPPRRVWYPTPAGPASRATYDLTFHVPHGMTIVTVGKLARQSREGAFDVSEWTSDVPISQAVFQYLGENFGKTTTDETTNMELSAYVAAGRGVLPESKEDVLIDAGNSVRVFEAWFGPPSFDRLAVVVSSATDSLPGVVYANPVVTAGYGSLVAQSLSRSRGRSAGPPPTIKTYLDEAFPREVARQWWGNTVAPASFHDAWLSSGFANFSTSLYDLAAYLKPDEFRDHWVKAREAVLLPNSAGFIANDTGPVWMGLLNDTWRTRGAGAILSASKGGFILHMLRSMMFDQKTGDTDFRAMMQDYVKQFTNQSVSTEDFKALVERHMKPKMDLDRNGRMDWFFDEWVYGTEIPSYRLEYSIASEKGSKPVISGKVTQSGVSAGFKMRVPIYGEFAGRQALIGVMVIHGSNTANFKSTLPEMPKRVLLNPNHEVLAYKEEVKLVK